MLAFGTWLAACLSFYFGAGYLVLVFIFNLVLRFWWGDETIFISAPMFAAGTYLLAQHLNFHCPRCGTHVSANTWSRINTGTAPAYCTVCGRSRQGIRAFQYKRHPEPWDGQYHDEGGGPFPVDHDIADMALYYAQKRWEKKRR
ncbi:hypothetical protein AEYBE204_06010 [Asticcacaulis sp. YBE204]|nr:hypothetical protein AEYBE204_06010 [Asticcacaulis sp. YBE204]